MTIKGQDLRNHPIFSSLSEARREKFFQLAAFKRYRKGETIVHLGDIWQYLLYIQDGEIEAQKTSAEGRNLVVASFHSGDVFWGIAFFKPEIPMIASLTASQDSELALWKREDVIPLIKEEGAFSWALACLMAERMAHASAILEEMTFQPVASRLAKLLIATARQDTNAPITRSLTLDEMAARTGTTREMICRFLHRFADEGIIDITRTEYRITDTARLNDMAGTSKG